MPVPYRTGPYRTCTIPYMYRTCTAEFANMHNPVMFSTMGNGLWEIGQMGNGALGGFGALGSLG